MLCNNAYHTRQNHCHPSSLLNRAPANLWQRGFKDHRPSSEHKHHGSKKTTNQILLFKGERGHFWPSWLPQSAATFPLGQSPRTWESLGASVQQRALKHLHPHPDECYKVKQILIHKQGSKLPWETPWNEVCVNRTGMHLWFTQPLIQVIKAGPGTVA